MISILLADEHAIVRTGLKLLINNQKDMKVCWEADNGEEAVRLALEKQPDIVILDLSMPKMNGLVALRKIHDANRGIKIIVLTMHEEKEYIFRVLQAGASSYLLKSHQEDDLIEAIRTVYQGGAYLYPKVTKLLLEDYKDKLNTKTEKMSRLTAREQEVLSYIAKGYTNREIAEELFLSVKTIESHRARIMEKLNLRTRQEMVKFALEYGLLDNL